MWKFLKYFFSFFIFPQEPGLYIAASAFPFQSEPTRWLLCDKPQRIYFLRNTYIQTYIVCLKYASFSLPFLRASIHWSVKQAGMGGGGFKRPVSLLTFDLWSSWLKNYKTRLMFKHWCYIVLCYRWQNTFLLKKYSNAHNCVGRRIHSSLVLCSVPWHTVVLQEIKTSLTVYSSVVGLNRSNVWAHSHPSLPSMHSVTLELESEKEMRQSASRTVRFKKLYLCQSISFIH